MFIPKILLSTSCLPVLDTAKARMFYIWHFCHMVFKYEKGKLYFTNNFDQNTTYGTCLPCALPYHLWTFISIKPEILM